MRVEGRGHSGTSRDAVVLGVACPLGAVAAAVAGVAAVAAGGGRFPDGLVVLGDDRLPTHQLAQEVAGGGRGHPPLRRAQPARRRGEASDVAVVGHEVRL